MENKRNIPALLPRLQDILFLSIFLAALFLGPRMLNMDGDLPRHLAIGKYVLAGNFPPVNDIFSYTRYGTPFAPHKWLAGVLFYLAFLLFEEKGIVLLSAALLASTFTLVYSDIVNRTGLRLMTFPLVAGGAAISSLHWIARPHLFTMFFLAIWLVWSERLASGKSVRLWYFPVLMLIWNNVHGEFIAGFLITIGFFVAWIWDYLFNRPTAEIETGKRIGIVLVLITVVTLLNPVSLRAWGTLTSWMGNQYLMERTQETTSPNFLQSNYLILLLFLSASIFLLGMKQEKIPTRLALILAGFTVLTLQSARNIHLYGVVAPFVLASTLTGSLATKPIKRYEDFIALVEKRLNPLVWPTATVLFCFVLLSATPLGQIERFSPSFFPIQAVEWLQTHPQEGNMFNPFDWGGYLSLTLWPEKRVFVDSQGDVYGEEFLREYERIVSVMPGWQDILDKYDVRWAMLPRSWPLSGALAREGWEEVYRDNTAVVFSRGE